jgi:hypothetical protein
MKTPQIQKNLDYGNLNILELLGRISYLRNILIDLGSKDSPLIFFPFANFGLCSHTNPYILKFLKSLKLTP